MIIGHPDAVLNGQGEGEITLAESAVSFVREFEFLVKIIIDGPIQISQEEIASAIPSQKTFRFQLEACDKAWCHYLHHFVTWKLKDAKLLEGDLVRAACQLEFFMMQSKLTLGDDETLADDMEATKKQVLDEQKLIRGKLQLLSGNAGFKHMESALTEMRSKFIGDKKSVGPLKSSTGQISSSCPPHSLEGSSFPISVGTSYLAEGCQGSSGNAIIHSTYEIADSSPGEETSSSPPKRIIDDHQRSDPLLASENELLVNEIIHEHHHGLADTLNAANKDQNNVQALKREISKACIRFVEPLIKGHTGLEYLKNAFANRYGLPTDDLSSLTLTRQWLSSVHPIAEQEWDEYIDSLSALTSNLGSSQVLLPTTLRTGGAISVVSKIGSSATGSNKPGCNGERVDKLVRLGLLKLVSGIGGLTPEALPETLKLDISRLRSVQSQFQKTIVISTSLLILCQILLTEKLVTNSLDMENIVSEVMKQLYELLDSVEDVGISEIVAKISGLLKGNGLVFGAEKLQAKEMLMENVLGKSLQAKDPIFARVSHCIFQALRGVVFGGSGNKGRELAVALQRVGVALLADRVMEAAEVGNCFLQCSSDLV